MGSISTDKKTGQKRYFYYDKNEQKCSIWLGKIADAVADSFRSFADRIVNAHLMNVAIDAETSRWLTTLSDKYYEKLLVKGFVPPRRKVSTLGECIPKLIKARASTVNGQTIEIWQQSERSLYMFFGEDKKISTITRVDAESFRSWLVSNGRLDGQGGLKPTTVWKRLQHVVAFFESLVKGDEITKNPFEGLTMSPVIDEERNHYVDEKFVYQIMDVLPDAEWRLLVALWRFGGLRGSSEPLLLRWEDIKWKEQKIIIHAKKTKRYEGKATRTIPIFPELVGPLRLARHEANKNDVYVITKHVPPYLKNVPDRSKLDIIKANFGTIFAGYIERAGLKPWPKIVNNLRASMETDLLNQKYGKLSIQVITEWLGHSPKVMLKHYGRVREDDFKQVTQHKPVQVLPQPPQEKIDGIETPELCESPLETRVEGKKKLTVYSTVHSPAEGGEGGCETETPKTRIVTQTLKNKALHGKKEKKEEPCGNLPFYQSGEDRI